MEIDVNDTEDEHFLMIKRLQNELASRQALQSQLISILQRKQATELELQGKRQRINDLRDHLQGLLKVKRDNEL